jgi:hypothetical protein
MLKITPVGPGHRAVTLRLEGRLVGPWVEELRRACEPPLTEGKTITLNLAEVEFMDVEGVTLVSRLRKSGVVLAECPAFANEQLSWNDAVESRAGVSPAPWPRSGHGS